MSTVIIINGGGAIQAINRLVNISGYMSVEQRIAAQTLLDKFASSADHLARYVMDTSPNPIPEPPANPEGE